VAVHLAVAAAAHGKVSLIVDTDPQAAASRWGEWREGLEPEVIDWRPSAKAWAGLTAPRVLMATRVWIRRGVEL
jgi:hypothetical protein